jgi:hypothetical protein
LIAGGGSRPLALAARASLKKQTRGPLSLGPALPGADI